MAGEDQNTPGQNTNPTGNANGAPVTTAAPPPEASINKSGVPPQQPPSTQTPMANSDANMIGVVQVAGQKYATSLIWNAAIDAKNIVQEARESAQRLNGNGFCIYAPVGAEESLYGLSEASLGHKPGQVSLAARLATSVDSSYIGAFATENGCFWIVGIIDEGRIAFDKAFGSQEVAQREFLEMTKLVPWKKISCPASWSIEGAVDDGDLATLIGPKYAGPRIRPLGLIDMAKAKKWLMIIFGILVALFIIHLAYKLFSASKPKPVVKHTQAPPPKKVIMRPWAEQKKGDVVLQNCVHQILNYGAFIIPGWNGPAQVTCTADGVQLSLEKGDGTINWVLPSVPQAPGFTPQVSPNFSTVNVSWTLPQIPVYENVGRGDDIQKVNDYLLRNFVEFDQPIKVQIMSDRLAYSFDAQDDIRSFYGLLLNHFETHVIDKVTLSITDMKWSISGHIYPDKPDYAEETPEVPVKPATDVAPPHPKNSP